MGELLCGRPAMEALVQACLQGCAQEGTSSSSLASSGPAHPFYFQVLRVVRIKVTWVMLHKLLEGFKLGPGCDIVSTIVKFANFIMFDMVSFHIIPIPDGKWVGTWQTSKALAVSISLDWHSVGLIYLTILIITERTHIHACTQMLAHMHERAHTSHTHHTHIHHTHSLTHTTHTYHNTTEWKRKVEKAIRLIWERFLFVLFAWLVWFSETMFH